MKYIIPLFVLAFLFTGTVAQTPAGDWPVFRGRPDLSGRSDSKLPSEPKLLWSLPTGARTKSSPVISDGTVFFGNDKGTLFAVSSDGKIKWKYEEGSVLEAPPLVFGNKVFIGSSEGLLSAVDKVTGKLVWSYKTENQISGSANVWVSGSRAGIVVGSYDYYLHCIDPRTGKGLWKVETDNYVNGTPAIHDGKIIFGGCDGVVRIVDPLTGNESDTINIGVYIASSAAITGDMAYLGDHDGTKYGVNIRTGKKTWVIPGTSETGSVLAIPAIGENKMVIGAEDKHLYCYNAADGKLLWKYRTNARITGSAVIAGGQVLFTGLDGFVTILSLANGSKLWSFNAGSPIGSSPAVTQGRFYILTDDGRLLAFG
jgi:outer membrane protein assembly factor BamB